MSTINYDYWPFAVLPVAEQSAQERMEIGFLQTAASEGYEAFRFGINDYGARSNAREGCILERGGATWEIRLAANDRRMLFAFVDDFQSAGMAVRHWLRGDCAKEVINQIGNHVVKPAGAKFSYVLSDEDCKTQ